MADKKPTNRSGASGGDRPIRRRDPSSAPGKAPRKFASDDKPRSPKGAKPAFDASKKAAPAKSRFSASRPGKSKPAPAPVEKTSAYEGERIAKAMARAGVCSRRDAEQWIAEGRVAVNGAALTSPAVNVTETDVITIDGAPMQARERTRLFLFHKPAGLVSTASDPEGRPTVFAFLEERHPDLPRLMSVGRLDINTEGLLLLTNDGGLARTLELPATGWTRRYRVRAHGETDQARLDDLKKGVTVDDVTYAPIDAKLERVQGANAWIAMSLTEGKNREVKRVLEHLGLDVTRLIRISYGPFQLGDLAEGAVEEVKLKILREQLGKSLAELAGVDFASPLREATATEQQEQREKSDKRSRKHVSVLRHERDARSEKGPRAKIERSATADRKGRAVAVERVTPTRRKPAAQEEAPSRNAKRFEAMRGGRRPPREESAFGGGDALRKDYKRPSRFERDAAEGPARDARARPRDTEKPRFERRPPRGDYEETRAAPRRPRPEFSAERPPREARGERRDAERTPRGESRDRYAQQGRGAGERPRGFGGSRMEARGPRAEARDDRPPRNARGEGRDGYAEKGRGAGERPRGFGGSRMEARGPRAEARDDRPPRDARDTEKPRFERRPPRGDYEETRAAPRRPRPEFSAERPPREARGERRDAERTPRGEGRDRYAEKGRGAGERPRGFGGSRMEARGPRAEARDDRPPRDARSPRGGAPRKGPPKSRGPGKGPFKGPPKRPGGPRKPRGE